MRNIFCKARSLTQIAPVFLASLSAFSSGNLFAFSSPAIPKLLSEYKFTIEEASYFTVIPPITMVICTPFFCKLADKVGRQRILLCTGIIHITAWLLVAFAKDIWIFYISRGLYGVGDACIFAALPAYIAEVTTPRIRNLYGNMLTIASFHGQFFSNCIGYYLSISTTGYVMVIFPILYLACFSFMPESPYYYVMVNNLNSARGSLQRLRGTENVTDELKQITQDVNRQLSESGRFKDLWIINSNRKALLIAILTRGTYQLSGFVALVSYSQYVFQEAGGDIPNGIASMIVSGILCMLIIFANVVSDKLGRKKSMIISCFFCGVTLLGEAIYFFLQMHEIVDLKRVNWFPVIILIAYSISFCVGIGIVPTLIAGEIFSTNIRKHGASVANVVFAAYASIFTKVFQLLMTGYGMWTPFLFFSLCCFANSVLSYFIVLETKGKTLEEIQQMLKENK
ncbi:hypothetical protein Trydic_g4149 [Trypoxylus dichotomus]